MEVRTASSTLKMLIRLALVITRGRTTIESLDPCHIIWVQLEVGPVARVDRGHEGLGISGVPKPQGMAQFVGCNDAKVHPLVGPLSPALIFIKVHAAQLWNVGMGQDPSWTKAKGG